MMNNINKILIDALESDIDITNILVDVLHNSYNNFEGEPVDIRALQAAFTIANNITDVIQWANNEDLISNLHTLDGILENDSLKIFFDNTNNNLLFGLERRDKDNDTNVVISFYHNKKYNTLTLSRQANIAGVKIEQTYNFNNDTYSEMRYRDAHGWYKLDKQNTAIYDELMSEIGTSLTILDDIKKQLNNPPIMT